MDRASEPLDFEGWRRAFVDSLDQRINLKGRVSEALGLPYLPENVEKQELCSQLGVVLEGAGWESALAQLYIRDPRKWSADYQRGLLQDAIDVNGRVSLTWHGLRTNEIRKRFRARTADHGDHAEGPCWCRRGRA